MSRCFRSRPPMASTRRVRVGLSAGRHSQPNEWHLRKNPRKESRCTFANAFWLPAVPDLVGSHLCDRLVEDGNEVLCLDNFFTGTRHNIAHLLEKSRFRADPPRDLAQPVFTGSG